MAVNTPTGNSNGAIKPRASKSAPPNKTAPIKQDKLSVLPWMPLYLARTKCGAANPTNAIKPVCATAAAVHKANKPNKTQRNDLTGKPKLSAVDSPKAKPSNKGLAATEAAHDTANTANIKPQAGQLTYAVEPSMNDCTEP
jgi:hypothetical protein